MKSLFGQNVFVVGFGTGVVVHESVVGGVIKCTVDLDSISSKGLRVEFDFGELIPTCKGLGFDAE